MQIWLVQLLAKNSVKKTFFRGVAIANLVSKVLVQLLAKNSVKKTFFKGVANLVSG